MPAAQGRSTCSKWPALTAWSWLGTQAGPSTAAWCCRVHGSSLLPLRRCLAVAGWQLATLLLLVGLSATSWECRQRRWVVETFSRI
eukprot:14327296-Alexandrium_andersonii.AAC.1